MKEKTDSLQKRMDDAKDQAALAYIEEAAQSWSEAKSNESLMLIGGIHTARNISKTIDSEVLRALDAFGKGGHYKALGYKTFAEFLDNSEFSPMSKSQFFEKAKFLKNEGAENFDLLNALNIPVRKRRLLNKGAVEIDGDQVIVRDGDSEVKIEINDRDRLMETLSALADANTEKAKRLEKGQEDFKRLKERVRDLEDSAGTAGGKVSQGEQLAGAALTSMAGLAAWVENATLLQVDEFVQRDLNLFAAQYRRLFQAIEKKGYAAEAEAVINTDEQNRLGSLLDEEDD